MIRIVYVGDPPPALKRSGNASVEALNLAIDATAPTKRESQELIDNQRGESVHVSASVVAKRVR